MTQSPGASQGLPSSFASELRKRASIVRVVGKYVKLKPSGTSYVGCCPFHNDQKPSMGVTEDKGLYHCFACGESGDVIKFVMGVEKCDWKDAVSLLVREYAPDLQDTSQQSSMISAAQRERMQARQAHLKRIQECLNAAASFYSSQLESQSAGGARTHLKARKLSPAVASQFTLGFAPPFHVAGARPLTNFLMQEGFLLEELVDAGLVVADKSNTTSPEMNTNQSHVEVGVNEGPISRKNAVDRFRNRLMVPIRNSQGDVVGFGARALAKDQMPKYLNSPETLLFKKSKLLFGFDNAKTRIQSEGSAVLVEGYFDAIALHARNLTNAVAVMGTAITIEQLKTAAYASMERNIILNMDADAAGIKAVETLCSSGQLLSLAMEGIGVKVADLPAPYKDPDECILNIGSQQYKENVLDTAKAWTEWFGDRILADYEDDDPEVFRRVVNRLIEFLSNLPAAERTFHCYKFAEKLSKESTSLKIQLEVDLLQQAKDAERQRHKNVDRKSKVMPELSSKAIQLTNASVHTKRDTINVQRTQLSTPSKHTEKNEKKHPPIFQPKKRRKTDSDESQMFRNKYGKKQETPAYWQPLKNVEVSPGKNVHQVLAQAELQLLLLLIHDAKNRKVFIEAIAGSCLNFTSADRAWLYNSIIQLPVDRRECGYQELLVLLRDKSEEARVFLAEQSYLRNLFEDNELLKPMTMNSDILLQTTLITILQANAELKRRSLLADFGCITKEMQQIRMKQDNLSIDTSESIPLLLSQQNKIAEDLKIQAEVVEELHLKKSHYAERVMAAQDKEKELRHIRNLEELMLKLASAATIGNEQTETSALGKSK